MKIKNIGIMVDYLHQKAQSFPEQLSKNKGTHVWFFTDDGKAKDSTIDYIMVTKYLAIISPGVRFLICLVHKSLN